MNNNKKTIVKTTCPNCGLPIVMSIRDGEVVEVTCPGCKETIIIRS